jgi:hypothetical protein
MASENEHLSRDEIRLVQETFDRLWPTARTSELFYTRLFEIAPNIRPMFHKLSEMGKQVDKVNANLIWPVPTLSQIKERTACRLVEQHRWLLGRANWSSPVIEPVSRGSRTDFEICQAETGARESHIQP